ncbi:DUF6344 domain-containing protein [Streptomyces sp. NPDC046862]|uniref:DUF6344 domain-containing protein n=1 Tax=Streptomyces sp. NPDC046862 TaxID=3154603 RepID=UPI0034564D32
MARNQVRTLWTAVVTAFLALFTALGLITTTASAAVPQTEPACKSGAPEVKVQAPVPWIVAYARSLPPTMEQRIRAEAHGASPSCRHRTLTQAAADAPGSPGSPRSEAAPAPATTTGPLP